MKKYLILLKVKIRENSGMRQWILISSAFSFMLLLIRIITSRQLSYGFLAWNLFLAYTPLLISNWLHVRPWVPKEKLKLTLAMFSWILFLPNSFYIVTDLFHLQNSKGGHPWFDLVLILSFAWNGILFGIISIRQMELWWKQRKPKIFSGVMIAVVMWLSAVGVYIGRFLRFNSWDVLINPLPLMDNVLDMMSDPFDHKQAWAMSVCYASFMVILYYTVKKLSEVFKNG